MADGFHKLSNGESGLSVRTKLNAPLGRFTERRPMFTIRFDDGLTDLYTSWKPFFDSKGIVACSSVIASYPDSVSGYMTWEQIRRIEADGWEIMCHGYEHEDWRTKTDAEIQQYIEDSVAIFDQQKINVKNIVPPGYSAESVFGRKISRQYFRSLEAGYVLGLVEGPNPPAVDLYNLCAVRGDIAGDYIATTPEGVVAMKALIDEMESDNLWMTYYFHTWSQEAQDGLEEIINYVISKNIDIVTHDSALDVFEPYSFIGMAFGVSEDSVLINQAHGEALWIDDNETHVGLNAGKGSKNGGNTFIGHTSGRDSEGDATTFIGSQAGRDSKGNSVTAFGYRAAFENEQGSSTFIGSQSGEANTGAYSTGIGQNALKANSQYGSTAVGQSAGERNSGTRGTFLGLDAGQDNSGANSLGLGSGACENNAESGRFEVKQKSANTIPLLFGNFISRLFGQGVPNAVPADVSLENNSMSFYLDEAADTLNVKVKYSDGSVKTALIANLI